MKSLYLCVTLIIGIILLGADKIEAQWNHTGPEGGEVRAMCSTDDNTGIDPIIFAAPFSGGIYRSMDNGATWSAVNNGLTEININVTALEADGPIIYAGTWGNGAFLSQNNGESWVEINNSETATTIVHAFLVKGTSLFMSTQGDGVFRTTNSGITWEQTNNGLSSFLDVRDLALIDTVIFAATWGADGVYRSTDDGESWTQVSTDVIPPSLADPCLEVNGNNLFLGTFGKGVFLSTDYGDNWTEVNNGIPSNATIRDFAVSGSNVYAATRGSGIFRTTNNGTNWVSVNSGLTTNLIESMMVNSNQDLFAGTFRKGIFRLTNNGTNWLETNSGFNANTISSYTTIPDGTGGHNLLAGTLNGVYQSANNGIDWTFLGLGEAWVTGVAVLNSDIFVSTMGTGIYRSTDGGATWTQSGLATANVHTIYSNGSDLFAGLAFFGGAQRSTDGGESWASVPGLEFKWVLDFTENEDYMFAGAVYGGAFRSSDNGDTFTPINIGLDNRVTTLAVKDSIVFAGTGDPNGISAAGVYRSTNNGDNWTEVNNGLPSDLIVWSLAFKDDNLFASSSSSGQNRVADVYLTTDLGESWSSVGTGLISNYIQDLFIDSTTIFAGGIGSSTWWRPLSEMISMPPTAPPTNLVAVADSFSSVVLIWSDNSDNEAGFVIERKNGDSLSVNSFVSIDSVGADVNSYLDLVGLEPDSTYTYRVYAYNSSGVSSFSNMAEATIIIVGVNDDKELVKSFSLSQNYPNPFNPSTVIKYSIPEQAYVTIKLYDVLGKEVATLVNGEKQAGIYSVNFDAKNLSSGIYFYNIKAGKFIDTKKMLLVK